MPNDKTTTSDRKTAGDEMTTPNGFWWWIAVNGSSCASSFMPLTENLKVSPVPEQLLGFETYEEQHEIQHFILNAPIDEVNEYMQREVPQKIASGKICYLRPANPEPPIHGPTMWADGPKCSQK